MGKPRKAPLFEIGSHWLASEPGSPFIHRYWTEPGTGRTRRASCRTSDLDAAKKQLAEIVANGAPKTERTHLSVVMLRYFEERTDKLPSAKHARLAGRTLLECWGEMIRAGAATASKQKEFAEWSITRGHSLGYISRNLSVLSAALGHSDIEIPVTFKEAKMVEDWGLVAKPRRKPYTPTDEEFGRIFTPQLDPTKKRIVPLEDKMFRWFVISLATGCRPEAALDLSPAARNRETGTLDLNPEDRTQNKKFRSTVREPRFLTAWLDHWEATMRLDEPYVAYANVSSVQTMLDRLKVRASVPKLHSYSCRHKIATVMRKARLPRDERDLQMGHAKPEGYGMWDPDYLQGVADALDAWWIGLQVHSKRSLFAPVADAENVQLLRRA